MERSFAQRILKMVEVAKSRRALARLLQVKDGTITGWENGSVPYPSTFQQIAERTKMSLQWLRDGIGKDAEQLEILRATLELEELMKDMTRYAGSPVEKLQLAMRDAGIDAKELARKCRVPIGLVQSVLSGSSQASEKLIEAFCKVLPLLSKDDLMEGTEHPVILHENGLEGTWGAKPPKIPGLPDAQYIPLLSWTQAGALASGLEQDDTVFDRDRAGVLAMGIKDPNAFGLEVKGDSMDPEIKERDRVVVCPNETARAGDTVIVRTMEGDVMCKIYHPKEKTALFVSINDRKHPPIEIPRSRIKWLYPVRQVLRFY